MTAPKPIDLIIFTNVLVRAGTERVTRTLANYCAEKGMNILMVTISDTGLPLPASHLSYPWVKLSQNKKSESGEAYSTLKKVAFTCFRFAYTVFFQHLFWSKKQHVRWLAFPRKKKIQSFRRLILSHPKARILSMGINANVIALLAAQGLHRKVYISERLDFSFWGATMFDRVLLAKMMYHEAEMVICNSRQQIDQLKHFVALEKLRYIPNPLMIQNREDDPPEKICFDHPVFLMVGRFTQQKAFDTLFHAFSLLSRELPDWKLVLIGVDTHGTEVQQLTKKFGIEKRVERVGFVKNPVPFYQAADIFVLPSRAEGQSNAMLEAAYFGLPLIVSDIPAFTELLKHGENAWITRVNDAKSLAEGMEKLATDIALRNKLGNEAKKFSEEFHLEHVMEKWESLLF